MGRLFRYLLRGHCLLWPGRVRSIRSRANVVALNSRATTLNHQSRARMFTKSSTENSGKTSLASTSTSRTPPRKGTSVTTRVLLAVGAPERARCDPVRRWRLQNAVRSDHARGLPRATPPTRRALGLQRILPPSPHAGSRSPSSAARDVRRRQRQVAPLLAVFSTPGQHTFNVRQNELPALLIFRVGLNMITQFQQEISCFQRTPAQANIFYSVPLLPSDRNP